MTYLLIALVLAIILSPLLSLRSSPRQKLIADLRQCASRQGLQVKLSAHPATREEKPQLDSAIYRLGWPPDSEASSLRRAEQWLLVRSEERGDRSDWDGWRWLTLPPAAEIVSALDGVVPKLIADVSGLEASSQGVAFYWSEHGDTSDVERMAEALKSLQTAIRPCRKEGKKQEI